jgi:hypothetical protein
LFFLVVMRQRQPGTGIPLLGPRQA